MARRLTNTKYIYYTVLASSIRGSINSRLARNVIFGPNNTRFPNYVDRRDGTLTASYKFHPFWACQVVSSGPQERHALLRWMKPWCSWKLASRRGDSLCILVICGSDNSLNSISQSSNFYNSRLRKKSFFSEPQINRAHMVVCQWIQHQSDWFLNHISVLISVKLDKLYSFFVVEMFWTARVVRKFATQIFIPLRWLQLGRLR